MKNIFIITLALSALLGLGCAKSGGSDNNQQTTTVMTADCVTYPQSCNTNTYNNQYGFQPYQTYNNGTYFYNNGYYGTGSGSMYYNANGSSLCNCPEGTVPTYNSYAGMGCVNSGMMNDSTSAYAYYGWSTGPNNNQWMNIPQISNYVGYPGQSCYNGVVQSCLTDQQNMCGVGFTCRASSAQSRMGLCVSNSASSSGQIFR